MLRMSPVASAKRAEDYYGKSDGGYYVGESDLRRRWGGKGAELLGLKGAPDFEQFKRLSPDDQMIAVAKAINCAGPDDIAYVVVRTTTGTVVFARWADQRLYRLDPGSSEPVAITTARGGPAVAGEST